MELNPLELFTKILDATNINAFIIKSDGSNLEMIDNRFRIKLYENYSYGDIFSLLNSQVSKDAIFHHTDEFLFNYFFLCLPDAHIPEGDSPLDGHRAFFRGTPKP